MVEEPSLYRVTCCLARLIARLSPEELHGAQRLTQDELAAQLGTVREVIARALQELQRTGAVRVQRGRIFVTDLHLLREMAMVEDAKRGSAA
ncbi:MAG TPA: winged helix-turn-helix domain-containing protein [Anaerolineae bacterium]|nr:winged helix-turn-helix domain-containing protein [Anaerolineae bacterium]HID84777.1 helix-turn-helix domain-containing protein [Anaerolineales bacterium]HIQ09819.1 helix-turn-helix domain-containing protein [Anaerolineaceae bacterium]